MKDRRVVRPSPLRLWSGRIAILAVTITAACRSSRAGVVAPARDTWAQNDVNAVQFGSGSSAAMSGQAGFGDARGNVDARANPDTFTLPDPRTERTEIMKQDPEALPAIVIPRLSSDPAPADPSANKGAANAIPLPPAVQSGLTGLAALGMAGLIRRLRRAFH